MVDQDQDQDQDQGQGHDQHEPESSPPRSAALSKLMEADEVQEREEKKDVESTDEVHAYHATLYRMMQVGYDRAQRKLQRLSEKRAKAAERLTDQFEGLQVRSPSFTTISPT